MLFSAHIGIQVKTSALRHFTYGWGFVCRAASNWIPGKTAEYFGIAASIILSGHCARRRLYHSRAGKEGLKRRGSTTPRFAPS